MPLPSGYTLPKGNADGSQVGSVYHLALGTKSDPSLANPDSIVGFMLENMQGQDFQESTDVNARQSFTSHSGPNLLDRDLVSYPRETQGDFSGGILQPVYITKDMCYDSDLFLDNAGYLQLQSRIVTVEMATSVGASGANSGPAIVAVGTTLYMLYGDGVVYQSTNGSAGGSIALGANAYYICTDGKYLYALTLSSILRWDGSAVVTVASSLNGTFTNGALQRLWFVDMGSNGYRLFYLNDADELYYMLVADSTSFPIALTSQYQVAAGNTLQTVVDVAPFATGFAFATKEAVWYNDGQNSTLLYAAGSAVIQGIAYCQGNLYAVVNSLSQGSPSSLVEISGGTATVVVSFGVPTQFQPTEIGYPSASATSVYVPVEAGVNPISGVSSAYLLRYNVLTKAVSHTPTMNALVSVRAAHVGESAAVAYTTNPSGTLLGWMDSTRNTFSGPSQEYQTSGKLVTSVYDFSTPSIAKLFRRVFVSHAPLPLGASITVEAHIGQDPTEFVAGTTSPSPSGATITNSTTGSTLTVLTLPTGTRGLTGYFVLTLNAGNTDLTTPVVYWMSTEIGIGWTWKFKVGCFRAQQTLAGMEDQQGLKGRDKYFFLQQLQENALTCIFYHPNGVQYPCTVEQLEFNIRNPIYEKDHDGPADLEFVASLSLRWSEAAGVGL